MCKVSVIIPSYNHEKFIGSAIESVLCQSFTDYEIVIVDDGSSDNSVSIIKEYANKDKRIRLFESVQNQGACAAMNRCIKEAKGEYLAVLNSDDMFTPDKLLIQVQYLDEHPEIGAVFSWVEFIDENDDTIVKNNFVGDIFEQDNRTRFEWLNHFFYNFNCLCHPTLLIRRECYENVGLYNETMTQLPDFDMWIRLCCKYEIYVMPEKLVKYRVLASEMNASVLSGASFIRHEFDFYKTMNSFLNMSFEEFKKVFKSIDSSNLSENTYKYMIAKEALKHHFRQCQLWGIDVIDKMMHEPVVKEELRTKLNFTTADFHKLYSKYDLFGTVYNDFTQLFFDCGKGYSERESITQQVTFREGAFKFSFKIPAGCSVKTLRWDPVESNFCHIYLTSAYYFDKNNHRKTIEAKLLSGQGYQMNDHEFYLTSGDPQLYFDVDDSIDTFIVEGTWKPNDISELTSKFDDYTKLYFDSGKGFIESDSITKPCFFDDKNFIFTFKISAECDVKTLRWDPVGSAICHVSVTSAYYLNKNNDKKTIVARLLSGQGYQTDDQDFILTSGDPQLYFDINDSIDTLVIEGRWKPLDLIDLSSIIETNCNARIIEETKRLFGDITQLYIDNGNGFSENDTITQECLFRDEKFEFCFKLPTECSVKMLRWDPIVKDLCHINLNFAYYVDKDNNKKDVKAKLIKGQGYQPLENEFILTSGDPQLYFDINNTINTFVVGGTWKPFDVNSFSTILPAKSSLLSKLKLN